MSAERILATYLLETPHTPELAAEALVNLQSAGTFTRVPGETEELRGRFQARIESVEPLETIQRPTLPYWTYDPPSGGSIPHHRAKVEVSIPLEMTGTDFATLLGTVAGGVYSLRELSGLRLLDLQLPRIFGESHPGPQFGIEGTRKLTGTYGRPIIASIIKPNVGLTPRQTAAIVRSLAEAGIDFIKDDEKMTSPPYSPLPERVDAVMRVINEAADRTGRKVMFAFNISNDDPEVMVRNHDTVEQADGTCVMVSINQIGFAGMNYLRRRCRLPIHAHRNGWAMFTRCPALGMEFQVYQKLWRLAGVDHLHVNGIRNKYWETDDSVVKSVEACLTPLFCENDRLLPVVGSGMWAGQVPETYRRTGTVDLVYIAGGGIQGHPGGPKAGVLSLRQAWKAAMSGTSLEDFAREHVELRQAIEKFGNR